MATGESVEVKKSVPVVCEVDVLVVGSGIAGSTAAVTAARNGTSKTNHLRPHNALNYRAAVPELLFL